MRRIQQLAYIAAVLSCCWFGMMAVHEFGHVLGAIVTGGRVECVVLHPLSVSRTDVHPNPNPVVVVWMGPLVGALAPLAAWFLVPRHWRELRPLTGFFAGFCLVANGAYIGIGSIDRVGDCHEMIRTGSPIWMLIAFGVVTTCVGFAVWHQLGTLRSFLCTPSKLSIRTTLSLTIAAVGYALVASVLSQR